MSIMVAFYLNGQLQSKSRATAPHFMENSPIGTPQPLSPEYHMATQKDHGPRPPGGALLIFAHASGMVTNTVMAGGSRHQ